MKNGSKYLRACLAGILNQSVSVEEIVIVDSGSSDDSVAIASNFQKVRVEHISPSSFNHGGTRNLALKLCRGDLIVFTVQDAVPDDCTWLSKLLSGFENERVAAVCGAQIVPISADTNPIEWYKPQTTPKLKIFEFQDADEFDRLTPEEKKAACSWDNVNSVYKRSILAKLPFRSTNYGEDLFWACDALLSGHALAYMPSSKVRHYHEYDYENAHKRTIVACLQRLEAFGYIPEHFSLLKNTTRVIWRLAKISELTLTKRAYWLIYNLKMLVAMQRGIHAVRSAHNNCARFEELKVRFMEIPPIPNSARLQAGER